MVDVIHTEYVAQDYPAVFEAIKTCEFTKTLQCRAELHGMYCRIEAVA